MKIHTTIKLLFVNLIILTSGCKKESKELTTVNFHLYNPVTSEGITGIEVSILQVKRKGSGFNISEETETIWQGVTDANGKATHSFKCYNNDKYSYWQTVEETFYFDANKVFLIQPEYQPLNKNDLNEVVYKVVENNTSYFTWLKNLDCFNQFDRMRYKKKSIVDVFDDWSSWSPGNNNPLYPNGYFEGCFELGPNTHTHTQDIWDVEMEVTKNGITTIIRDTFYITGQNGTDTLKYFY